ncbi:MAG: hypothetical protein ABI345_11920 [Jatrophihabitans sp.]
MAALDIKWDGLREVAAVSLLFALGVVLVFTLGVIGLSRADAAREALSGSSARTTGLALAAVAFSGCAVAVLYGLYLMIPQFH